MKQCKCGSFAVYIEKDTGNSCDVCHYRLKCEKLESEILNLKYSLSVLLMQNRRLNIIKDKLNNLTVNKNE